MHYYAPDTNRKGKRAGIIALAGYLAVFIAVSLLVSFDMGKPEEHADGILIDFGNETDGFGLDNVALAEEISASSSSINGDSNEELMTQENEDAPSIRTSPKKDKKTNTQVKSDNKSLNKDLTGQAREANRRSLFPGRSTTSDASSQGNTANAAGNAGNESGGDGSAGTGTGDSGVSFSLAGRRAVGDLPYPTYSANLAGRVVVEITVDSQGRVQSASFQPKGSTTQNASLRESALKAAKQARFTPNEANAVQTGTITYIFSLH